MLTKPLPWPRLKSSFYAGLQRSLRASRAVREQRVQCEHVYSHYEEKFGSEALAQADLQLRRQIAANELADKCADTAKQQHPELDKERLKRDKHAARIATQVAQMAGEILGMYQSQGKHERLPKK